MAATYFALFALAAVTAVGVPGPGDSALLAAGVLAAQGRLNLVAVLVVAFLGWLVGRAIGYEVGFRGGRPLLERPGRTQKFRLKALTKGDELFARFNKLGSVVAPAPISGINRVAVPIFAATSVVAALGWTLSTALPAFFLGEGAKAWLSKVGGKGVAVAVVVAAIGLLSEYFWRRRHSEKTKPSGAPSFVTSRAKHDEHGEEQSRQSRSA